MKCPEFLNRVRQSRYGFALYWLLSFIAAAFVLRLVLFFSFTQEHVALSTSLLTFAAGFHRDLLASILLTLPLLCWFAILSETKFHARWHRIFFWTLSFVLCSAGVFLFFIEYYFFEEFRSRFNTVAVDYLIYPHEVFVNIWDSYHVGWVIAFCALVGSGWVMLARALFSRMWEGTCSRKQRLAVLTLALVACIALGSTVPLKGARVSTNRTLNEIANTGAISFLAAVWTHHLDYAAFYRTNELNQAFKRVRELLQDPNSTFEQEGNSIKRRVKGDPAKPKLNVVIFLEESLGSEFWGCLGRKEKTLTPEMDALAAQEGMLFTNIYASGNRTVRGMEGVLSSFPPLPGDSIVKRDLSDNVETIARVLKRDGYSTVFLYGGRGVFDGMRSFAVRNGYDRFVEQKHFQHPTFKTIWGVCDEDLFTRTLQECAQLAQQQKPFFATVLSVSNHKPYTYPEGRIPENPQDRTRDNAVKYADYSLGQFFKAAKTQTFWTNTIFVVVADHGARVYGKQSIPIHSYEIPLVILGPAVVREPSKQGILGCSTDVAPTVLGLIGRPYESMFFGQDLLTCTTDRTRAFLNHNRDIGMLAGDRLAVLGLRQTTEVYGGDPKKVEMQPLNNLTETDQRLLRDTEAFYQVADHLYTRRAYRIDP